MRKLPLYDKFSGAVIDSVPPANPNPSCTDCPRSFSVYSGARCRVEASGVGGGILVVGSKPASASHEAQPFDKGAERTIADKLQELFDVYGLPVAYTYAEGCPGSGKDEAYAACRKYLRWAIQDATPKAIVLMGYAAQMAVLGKSFDPTDVRKGFAMVNVGGAFVPALITFGVNEVDSNHLYRKAYYEDVLYLVRLLSRNVAGIDFMSTPWTSVPVYVVESRADAQKAYEHLSNFQLEEIEAGRDGLIGTDVEAAGMMFEDDYMVTVFACAIMDAVYVFPRRVFEEALDVLHDILEVLSHTTWNGQYDYCAFYSDPIFRKLKVRKYHRSVLNLQSDGRIKRKLVAADALAKLELAAALVGMGGHKEEDKEVAAAVKTDISKFVTSKTPTPSGRQRAIVSPAYFKESAFPPRWLEYIRDGHEIEAFVHAFIPEGVDTQYVARDAYSTYLLERVCAEQMKQAPANDPLGNKDAFYGDDDGLEYIWNEVAQPNMWAWCRGRINGMPLSLEALKLYEQFLDVRLEETIQKIQAIVPGMNPGSNPQVSAYLQKIGVKPKRKTAAGAPSYSNENLLPFAAKYPFVSLLLQFRMLQKQHGTYAVGLQKFVRSDGAVHASVLPDGTETGRPSSSDPNIFNITKGRTPEARELSNMLRDAFAVPPGYTILELDESQIEVRGISYLAKIKAMADTFRSGEDFHRVSAVKFAAAMGKVWDSMTADQQAMDRDNAKTTVFAAAYDIPVELPFMLAQRLHISIEAATKLAAALFGVFPEFETWMSEMYEVAWKTGHARTVWKGKLARRRPIWGLGNNPPTLKELQDLLVKSKETRNYELRKNLDLNAARNTWNGPNQGGASDVLNSKLWKIQCWLDDNTQDGKFICQVYDSVMVVVREEEADKTSAFLRTVMTEPVFGDTPLAVDEKRGSTWASLKKPKKSS